MVVSGNLVSVWVCVLGLLLHIQLLLQLRLDRTGIADDVRVINQLPETFFFVGITITEQCDSSQKQEIFFLRSCRRRR
jgi:hypothetical protein